MNQEELYDNLMTHLELAKKGASQQGGCRYVARDVTSPTGWTVTDRMPFMGEWYDTDGIQHG